MLQLTREEYEALAQPPERNVKFAKKPTLWDVGSVVSYLQSLKKYKFLKTVMIDVNSGILSPVERYDTIDIDHSDQDWNDISKDRFLP